MEPTATSLDALDYLRSVSYEREFTQVYEIDGAGLYRIADGHFVVLKCVAHDEHKGYPMLRRVLPPHWDVFAAARNDEDGFEAHHYGPVE
jgi:hypothetical protein